MVCLSVHPSPQAFEHAGRDTRSSPRMLARLCIPPVNKGPPGEEGEKEEEDEDKEEVEDDDDEEKEQQENQEEDDDKAPEDKHAEEEG